MSIPSNGITPEVIRGVMPPYRLSPDLMAATIAALPAPPPDSTVAWRQARLTRVLQEIAALKPADAAQARIAAQLLTTRELANTFTVRAQTPNLEINQMCRLGRTAAELLRSAAALDRTLARHQQMPTPFFGIVVQDEVDIPALESIWASGIPAPTETASPISASADSPTATVDGTPPPATQPAAGRHRPRALVPGVDPVDPPRDPAPTPKPATPPHPQAQPDQSPGPATPPDSTTPEWSITKIDEGPGWSREVLRHRSAIPTTEKAAAR